MSTDLTFHVLLALAVVVIAGHLLGRLLAAIGQPPVIGEVLSGILLGPSLLGRVAPGVEAYLFPDRRGRRSASSRSSASCSTCSWSASSSTPGRCARRAAPFVFTSQASIAVPFLLGLRTRHRSSTRS